MAPGVGDSLVRTITEEGEFSWEKCLAASEEKLLVIDCHQEWCGRCETLQPTFLRISLETTDCENRCLFLEANLDKFAHRVQALLPKDTTVNLATQGCMPFTALIKAEAGGDRVWRKLARKANREKTDPKFEEARAGWQMLGGVTVASISGCDAPAILRQVNKHMPPLRTGDDKAEPE